ncbi:MAG: L-seryl-tRNA(Sec) selenium transferase [Vicinamibacterales bacterium]
MTASNLRAIPSVDRVLRELGETQLPRPLVLDTVRRELQASRRLPKVPTFEDVLGRLRDVLSGLRSSRIRPLINGTGILVHTNLGRVPLGPAAVERMVEIASNYNNLEYGLGDGKRGARAAYLERCLAVLCAAEAATVVNNNAAALVLLVSHLCRADKNEVVISRGELVQIGGGFRVPEILESSGARLREVGTTNKTSLADYSRALTKRTALILKVHRSNFFMDGFVASPSTPEIAALAHKKRVPFIEDLGSGAVFDTAAVQGLEAEPTPAALLREGVDAVCFSGDKLLGGPQAGIIVGRARIVAGVKREPLFRALRCDKLVLASLEATVDLHMNGGSGIPIIDMLHTTESDLHARAAAIVVALRDLPMATTVGTGRANIGGGAQPRSDMPSATVDLKHDTISPNDLALRLRTQDVPVVGYIARGLVRVDLRTIFPRQDALLIASIRNAVVA